MLFCTERDNIYKGRGMMYEIIKKICAENNMSVSKLCEIITGSKGNLGTWKKGSFSVDTLVKIADYFKLSADYLLGRTDQNCITNIQAGNNNILLNNTNDIFNNPEVSQAYSELSTQDKLEVQLEIIKRNSK